MVDAPHTPHDSYFRLILTDLHSAEVLIADQLAGGGLAVVAGSVVALPSDYIDARLRRSQSDAAFEFRATAEHGEQSALGLVLFEHKSTPDRAAALQLLRYQVGLWERWLAQDKGLPLPPIICIVVHQGPPTWRHPTAFAALFEPLVPEIAAAIPDFSFRLIDLSVIDDSALSHDRRLRAMLMILKYGRRPDLKRMLPPIIEAMPALSRMEVKQTMGYLSANSVGVTTDDIVAALEAARSSGADTMGIIELMEERGLAKGREQGQSAALVKVLRRRFGDLPPAITDRIREADAELVERWFDAALDGAELSALFPNAP